MKKRIFRSICAVALASLLLLCVGVIVLVYQTSTQSGFSNLRADTTFIAVGVENGGEAYLQSIRRYPGRVTWIAPDGTVLYDDREDAQNMDNHASRPEVAAALQTGAGQAQRQSGTMGERTLYYAQRLTDGSILRLSIQVDNIWAEVLQFVPWLIGISLLLIVAAALLARWQTRRIVQPVNQLDLDAPFDADAYDELAPLLRKIAAQKQQIEKSVQALKHQQAEFAAITQSMNEGLLVVDAAGKVLTINQSAQRILGIAASPDTPLPLLELSRNLVLEEAVKAATAGRRTEHVLALNGRQYRLLASPSGPAESVQGAVLLLMDDTENLQAEQTRREFSANVSHELKTPLTSISGYAEIIRDGLVQPQDIPAFAGKIYDESARLMALVNDIIKLSRLDERQAPAAREPVDLFHMAGQTAAALQTQADDKSIALAVTGAETTIPGVPAILSEVLFNLVDNAIRYTQPGGQVQVAVGREGPQAFIRVADTGIGIPPEHQPHIFERFYRVDKSHARESGGTGLGLSIVKRGALFHGGRVEASSQPGHGSTFTVWLPAGTDA
ncbi:MAG: PAS domain-containing protein [Ruminococcaceae bacterium]|nr:PAS domain-containing protein [Oscillospiraceae bacterium]